MNIYELVKISLGSGESLKKVVLGLFWKLYLIGFLNIVLLF